MQNADINGVETVKHENVVLLSEYLDNLLSIRGLSGSWVFFWKFSKLSTLYLVGLSKLLI